MEIEIVKKREKLPFNTVITIKELLGYSTTEVANIDPLTQGTIVNNIKEECKKLNIYLEPDKDIVGGLAYVHPFKKVDFKATSREIELFKLGVPENLIDYVYVVGEKIYPKQKLPKELEQEYENFINKTN